MGGLCRGRSCLSNYGDYTLLDSGLKASQYFLSVGIIEILLSVVFVLSFGVGVTIAMGEASHKEFLFARLCFIIAALAIAVAYFYWLHEPNLSLGLRIIWGIITVCLIFVCFLMVRWVHNREKALIERTSINNGGEGGIGAFGVRGGAGGKGSAPGGGGAAGPAIKMPGGSYIIPGAAGGGGGGPKGGRGGDGGSVIMPGLIIEGGKGAESTPVQLPNSNQNEKDDFPTR